MITSKYTRLPKSQQIYISILLGGYALLLLNSLLLLLFDRSTADSYMTIFVLHLVFGVVLLPPLLVFLVLHILKMPIRRNNAVMVAGILTTLSVILLFVSGFVLLIFGAAFAGRLFLWLHIISTFTTILGFIAHVSLKKEVKYHFLHIELPWKVGFGRALKNPLNATLSIGLFAILAFFAGHWTDLDAPVTEYAGTDKILAPGEARLDHDTFFDDDQLGRSESCGQSACHPDIFKQWQESVHHFSSFNNPYYRATVELLIEEKGADAVRWCASCHDPMMLFTGRMQDQAGFDMDHPNAQAGLTCLSCHAATALRDVRGNGRYVIAEPDEYPFSLAKSGPAKWLHDTLIRSKPEPHRTAMLKSMHITPEYCGSCHKVGVPPHINDYHWKRGQDQYDSWHISGVSGNTIRSFYVPPQSSTCTTCHMPLVPSNDAGNENGYIRSHRFATANATLPFLKDKPEQLNEVEEFLSDSVVTLDIFRIELNGKAYGPDTDMPLLKGGDHLRVSVVVRNRKVGHIFPAGTNDSNESWIELTAYDDSGNRILASGLLDADGFVDSTAHFFGARLVDKNSNLVAKRDIQNWVSTVYSNTIPPGAAHVVHYRFTVPDAVNISQLTATLYYRKFNQSYHNWVFTKMALPAPEQPIITMHTASRSVGTLSKSPRPLWERWNDYGIGLLLQADTRTALEAFRQVSKIAPGNPEGLINQIRILIEEGQLDRVAEALQRTEEIRPGYLKTAYFRALLYKRYGEYDDVISELMKVVAIYPRDREILREIGRMHYLSGRYQDALDWQDKILAIDPEDIGALYNRMLALAALGDSQFQSAKTLYEYHKEDEDELSYTAPYKRAHPFANLEAQQVHDHPLLPVENELAANEHAGL